MSDIDDLKRVIVEIAKAKLTVQDMRNMGNIAMRHRKEHFNAGKDPDGNKWERLRLDTVKRKKRKKMSDPLKALIATGHLRDMYVGSVSKDQVTLKYANDRSRDVSGGNSIAEIHDQGLGNVPARKHMAIPATAVTEINRYFNLKVAKEWKRLFGKLGKIKV
jgi:hypothetical protein